MDPIRIIMKGTNLKIFLSILTTEGMIGQNNNKIKFVPLEILNPPMYNTCNFTHWKCPNWKASICHFDYLTNGDDYT